MQVNNPQKPKNDGIRIDGQTIRFTEPWPTREEYEEQLEKNIAEFD